MTAGLQLLLTFEVASTSRTVSWFSSWENRQVPAGAVSGEGVARDRAAAVDPQKSRPNPMTFVSHTCNPASNNDVAWCRIGTGPPHRSGRCWPRVDGTLRWSAGLARPARARSAAHVRGFAPNPAFRTDLLGTAFGQESKESSAPRPCPRLWDRARSGSG